MVRNMKIYAYALEIKCHCEYVGNATQAHWVVALRRVVELICIRLVCAFSKSAYETYSSHETVLLNFAIDWAKSPMTASAKVAITTIRLGIARTASMGNDLQLDLELHKRHAECTKNNNMGNDLRIWTGTCLE